MDVIFDIDGTLADVVHRRHFVASKPKNWAAFNAAAHLDKVIEPVAETCRRLRQGAARIIFATGREGTHAIRTTTMNWLLNNGIGEIGDFLFMRGEKDYRPDHIVKEEILAEMRAKGFKPTIAFDDRQQVVDMWRRNGLICAQVAVGDF